MPYEEKLEFHIYSVQPDFVELVKREEFELNLDAKCIIPVLDIATTMLCILLFHVDMVFLRKCKII